eukprot:TRINITY_DN440_c4_g1_i1.p1 TRINITY_DN440_c4_g1~~TRINITY_DN440_c4_g1_i1.p1  ORF type:complete len:407 (+),score=94.47 TRINITY_DN440_c4_g1_i1:308-1528(+)
MRLLLNAVCVLVAGYFLFIVWGLWVGSLRPEQPRLSIPWRGLPDLAWHEALDYASAGNETVIVTVASYSHRLQLLNWLAMVNRARGTVSDVLIVCMDTRIAAWLHVLGKDCAVITTIPEHDSKWRTVPDARCVAAYLKVEEEGPDQCRAKCVSEGVACHAASFSSEERTCSLCREAHGLVTDKTHTTHKRQRLSPLFQMRMRLIQHFLASSPPRNVLMSDIDAVWLSDPIPALKEVKADVVAQRGSHPKVLATRWGATLCMGFLFLKAANRHLASFARLAVSDVDFAGDDQEGFNVALLTADLTWEERLEYDKSTSVDYGFTTAGFRVALLPHSEYRRRCDASDSLKGVVVAHCYDKGIAKSNSTARIQRAKDRGLWVLRNEWRDLPVVPPLDSFLSTITTRHVPV